MKRRILLAVLVGISLILGVMLRIRSDVNQRKAEEIRRLLKMKEENRSEFDAFDANRRAFYQYASPTANEERIRMRNLHDQLQNAPDRKQLTDTMERYVAWLKTIEAPTQMRELQTYSDEKRIDLIEEMLKKQKTQQGEEETIFSEGLRERIKAELPEELRNVDPSPLYHAFDSWITERYNKFRESLKPEQQQMASRWLELFSQVFAAAPYTEVPNAEGTTPNPGMLEKIALLSFERKLGASVSEMPGRPDPMGPGGRMQTVSPFMFPFLMEVEQALDEKKTTFLDDFTDENVKTFLKNATRQIKYETLAKLLALGILAHYPKANLIRLDPYSIDRQWRRDRSNQLTANYADFLSILNEEQRNRILSLPPDVGVRVLSQEFFGGVTFARDLFMRIGGRMRGRGERGPFPGERPGQPALPGQSGFPPPVSAPVSDNEPKPG
ncbi:MAG: hypothetical protein FWC50_04990 [Planctomycetaceae bacterium]|nr:hypothetical protein [Planctomycetaceae bacterium]